MTFLYPYTAFDPVTMVFTSTGAAWTVDEFADAWLFVVGQDATGCHSYGVVASNTADTITLSSMIDDGAAATGNILIYNGYSIDFVPDVSQPSVVRNLNVNEDCFEYSDNDDKRKLSTKVVASGKDLFGKTISVMLAAVHAYDNDKQMFSDATIVTRRSEGYVYKNNYAPNADARAVTANVASKNAFNDQYATDPTMIKVTSTYYPYFPLNARVRFSAAIGSTLPPNLIAGNDYWVFSREGVGYSIEVSATDPSDPAFAALDIGGSIAPGDTCYIENLGGLIISNTDGYLTAGQTFVIFGEYPPDGLTFGTAITNGSTTYSSANYWIDTGSQIDSDGIGVSMIKTSDVVQNGLGVAPAALLYGWGYTIPTGSIMAFCIPNSGSAGVYAETTAATTEATDAAGIQYTIVPLTAFPEVDFSGRGYLLNLRLYVQDSTLVGNNEVLIGEEKITISTSGNDTTYGNYIQFSDVTARVTSSTLKAYPHDVGALVARTNYTEASPESTSAITLNGIHIGNFTVDGNITYGQLDTYATYMLLGLGNFYKKATAWSPLIYGYVNEVGEYHGMAQTSRARPIAIGDRISFTEFTGDTPEEYEVVAVTIKYDEGRIFIECGDFEKNVFTSLQQSTNAVNRPLS